MARKLPHHANDKVTILTEKSRRWTESRTIVKQIHVPAKLANLVVK